MSFFNSKRFIVIDTNSSFNITTTANTIKLYIAEILSDLSITSVNYSVQKTSGRSTTVIATGTAVGTSPIFEITIDTALLSEKDDFFCTLELTDEDGQVISEKTKTYTYIGV